MILDDDGGFRKICPNHTARVFNIAEFPNTVQFVSEIVQKLKVDAIACSGHSGLIVCGAVALKTDIPVIAIRKIGDRAKADHRQLNGILHGRVRSWAIVDDLISSGRTVGRIIKKMRLYAVSPAILPKSVILYGSLWRTEYRFVSYRFRLHPTHKNDRDIRQAMDNVNWTLPVNEGV